jgi:hypothetical protein
MSYFWREIQIPVVINFAAINLKKIKDDYRENFADILGQSERGVSYLL